jgi:hypothetical protein
MIRDIPTRLNLASMSMNATIPHKDGGDKSRTSKGGMKSVSTRLGKEASKARTDSYLGSDRGSITFLLNNGTASFIESFRLPSSYERRNLFNFRNLHGTLEAPSLFDIYSNINEDESAFSDLSEDEPIDWALFEDENLLRFLNSPFAEMQMQTDDIFTPQLTDSNFVSAAAFTNSSILIDWESPSLQSSAIVQAMIGKAISLGLSDLKQAEMSQRLNFL